MNAGALGRERGVGHVLGTAGLALENYANKGADQFNNWRLQHPDPSRSTNSKEVSTLKSRPDFERLIEKLRLDGNNNGGFKQIY